MAAVAHHYGQSFSGGHWNASHRLLQGEGCNNGDRWVTYDDRCVRVKAIAPTGRAAPPAQRRRNAASGKGTGKLFLPGTSSATVVAYI